MMGVRRVNWLLAGLATLATATPADADIARPSTLQIYITRDGKPVETPVDLTVTCRGRLKWPGRSDPSPGAPAKTVELYRLAVTCPSYACVVYHNERYLYREIQSCEASGTAGGKPFRIRDIGNSPVGQCDKPSSQIKSGRRCTLRLVLPK